MEPPSTPSLDSKGANRFVTPRRRLKSPGDKLGRGKSQTPITQFYSPVSSPSEKGSQPLPSPKRRVSGGSPRPKKRLKVLEDRPVIVSSDDSDDTFIDSQRGSQLPAVPPLRRLDLVKRCLYPGTSYLGSSRKRSRLEKRSTKVLHSQLVTVSSDESSDEVFRNPRHDPKPPPVSSLPRQKLVNRLQDPDKSSQRSSCERSPVVLPLSQQKLVNRLQGPETSSQSSSRKRLSQIKNRSSTPICKPVHRKFKVSSSEDSCEEAPYTPIGPRRLKGARQPPSQTVIQRDPSNTPIEPRALKGARQPPCQREQCPDLLSQSVLISDSDDSDFELHNSKLSQSFSSQSFIKQTPLLSQSFLSRQIKSSCSITPRSATTWNVLPERSSTVSNHKSSQRARSKKSAMSQQRVSFSSSRDHKASPCGSQLDETIDPFCQGNRQSPESEEEFDCVEGGLPSIYLQDTLPPSGQDVTRHCIRIDGSPQSPDSLLESNSTAKSSKSSSFKEPVYCDDSIYDQETIDPASNPKTAMVLDQTADVTTADSVDNNPNALAVILRKTSLGSRVGVVDCSDDDLDESVAMSEFGSQPNRTTLGAIPLSELIDISHVSGSSDSDLPDGSFLDEENSIVGTSIGMFPRSPESPSKESLFVDDSDESSTGITPILKAVLDVSADFFSDVVSSFGTSGSGETDVQRDGIKKDVAGVESVHRPVDPLVSSSGLPEVMEKKPAGVSDSLGCKLADVPAVKDDQPAVFGSRLNDELAEDDRSLDGTPVDVGKEFDGTLPDYDQPAEVGGFGGKPVGVAKSLKGKSAKVYKCMDGQPAGVGHKLDDELAEGSSLGGQAVDVGKRLDSVSPDYETALDSPPSTDAKSTMGVGTEIKIVCGSSPPETSPKLLIAHNLDKSLLYNYKRPPLLDTILSECQNYADPVLNLEPIKTFVSQYSSLPLPSKSALHGCLLELLDNPNRWLKYSEASASGIDNVVSSGILEYLNTNDNLTTKLNSLNHYELSDIFSKLAVGPAPECKEMLRNAVFSKLTSSLNDPVTQDVFAAINRKFIKLTKNASFSLEICLELFALPLNLNDKLYKTVEIARFANSLTREQSLSKLSALPLRISSLSLDPVRVLSDLRDLCRLKSQVFDSDLSDESIYSRVNDICSTIAVWDISAETDPLVQIGPTYRFLVTNYVHALDEQLKKLLYVNCSDIEFGACIYLGFLLKQDVTGYQNKVKWGRERMRYLVKLMDSRNMFEEFSKTLKEPVSQVEAIVRTEFVSNALKMKKLGMTPDEKTHLTKICRPTKHDRTPINLAPVEGLKYDVLTKKTKNKNFELVRANIYEKFKNDYSSGVEDNGGLLMNAVFMVFWQAIYLPLDGAFVNKFQKSPMDWGSEQFFTKRATVFRSLASDMAQHGLPAVLKLIAVVVEKFSSYRSVVEWNVVCPNLEKINSLVATLGVDRFLKIALHLVGKLEERALGFPEIVLWNPESKKVKFLGLRKPVDQLHPYQTLWLEKLVEFGVEAEELQILGYIPSEQSSRLG